MQRCRVRSLLVVSCALALALALSVGDALAGAPSADESAGFDHSRFDRLLARHVDEDGRVDYAALRRDTAALDAYVDRLADAPLDGLVRDGQLALLINAYNAFTLRLIVDHYPVESIRDIPEERRWDDARWSLGGRLVSLNDIEHDLIRSRFDEPRIHFALVCAAVGCPPLRREAYVGERLAQQLRDQTRRVHAREPWFRYEPARDVVRLTRLYEWYAPDFEQGANGILEFAARHDERLREALASGTRPDVEWIDYDWTLNDVRPRD